MQVALTVLMVVLATTLLGTIIPEILRVFERQERPPLSRATVARLVREWMTLAFFALTMPLALLPSWPRRAITAGPPQPPVVLVPGYGLHRMGLIPLAAYLRRRQNRLVWAVNNPSWRDDIPSFARTLARTVERIQRVTGASQVDIVSHSMGGIVAAHYINNIGSAGTVRRLVTLGTPWPVSYTHLTLPTSG